MRTQTLIEALSLALAAAQCGLAQTQVDLSTQSKRPDFSQAASTRPAKTGTSLPVTCSVGDMYFKSDAAAGQNLYGCTTANNWSQLSGGSGGGGGTGPPQNAGLAPASPLSRPP